MVRRLLGVIAIAAIGASVGVLTQTPSRPQRPVFSTAVEYVEVDARVVDGKGNPVHNLKKEDFTVLEDGKAQTIQTFSTIDIPIEGTATTTTITTSAGQRIEPDVSQNQFRAEESRVFVILLDDRQIDAHRTQSTIRIVKDFIRRLGPRDLAAIISSSGRTDVSQTLTGNKTLLLKAMDGFIGRKLESAALLAHQGMKPRSYEMELAFEARSSLRALGSVVAWMAGMQGRSKVLLLLSEGLDYNIELALDRDGGSDSLPREEQEALAAATRGNVTIHPIDPRGLYAYDELTAMGGGAAPGLDAASRTARAFRDEVARGQLQLRAVAAETGGIPTVGSNKFEAALDQIISQHSTYYLLGYQAANPRRDGRFRRIEVKVNGRGLKVISRRGYREVDADPPASPAAPPSPAGAPPKLWEALNSPIPMGDLPMRATAAAFRGPDGKALLAVVVESPAESIETIERAGRFAGALQMIAAAVDRRNNLAAAESSRIDLQLGAGRLEQLNRDGFRALTSLRSLNPGSYQVRIALAPDGSERRGSIWFDVEVPDFSKGALAMSGLLVASTEKGSTPTANVGKVFEGVLPVSPTALRQFTPSDELVVFAEVYANRPDQADITVVVKDTRSNVVVQRTELVTAEAFNAEGGVHRSLTRLPLADLAPGEYVLSVEAKTRGDRPDTISRAVPLRIAP